LGREVRLAAPGVALGVAGGVAGGKKLSGLRCTLTSSQVAWSSFTALFPALITLGGGQTDRHTGRQIDVNVTSIQAKLTEGHSN